MKTFEKWLTEAHPEVLDEDWKKWARNAALAGTIGAAGLGLMQSKSPVNPSNSKAATSAWDVKRKEIRDQKIELQKHAAELKRHGLKQGTFVQGKLQGVPDSEPEGESSWTSPNAGDYLK